jgi:protein phosphatase 2C family protein 2/3
MEDSHCHLLQLGDDKTSFFAVYDGHGGHSLLFNLTPRSISLITFIKTGSTVARFAGSTLAARLASTPSFKARDFPTALSRAFLATDEDLRANPDFIGDPSGCTAVAVIVDHEGAKITCVCTFFEFLSSPPPFRG